MADLGQFPFKVRGVDLADTARIDAKGPAVSILDTAVFPEDRQVAASGSLDVTGVSAGAVAVQGAAAGLLDFTGSAECVVQSPIRIVGDDAPSWKRQFYDRQLKEFEDSLDEIVTADDPQEAAQDAVEAFRSLEAPSPIIRESLQAIAEALRGMTMRSLRRKEIQAEIADIRAELARVAEYRRKRRNNEAALLLLL